MTWSDGRRRTVRRTVVFTPEEWEQARRFWEACRVAAGHRTWSGHARELLMWGSVRQVIVSADADALTHQVMRIGVNVNQIAHRVNATGVVGREDVEELERLLAECRDALAAVTTPVQESFRRQGWQS